MSNVYGYVRISPNDNLPNGDLLETLLKQTMGLHNDLFPNLSSDFSDQHKLLLKKQYQEGLSKLDIEPKNIFFEVHPGDTFDRPSWKKLKDKLQKEDRVVVTTLKVFSTSTFRMTLKEIEILRKREIKLCVLELEMDETKTIWDYVTDIYDYFEQIRLDRQVVAIAAIGLNPLLRKAKYPGRKSVLDPHFFQQLQTLLKKGTKSPTQLAKELGKSRSTIYKALKLIREEENFS